MVVGSPWLVDHDLGAGSVVCCGGGGRRLRAGSALWFGGDGGGIWLPLADGLHYWRWFCAMVCWRRSWVLVVRAQVAPQSGLAEVPLALLDLGDQS